MLAIVAAYKDEVSTYLKRGGFKFTGRDEGFGVYRSTSGPDVVVSEGGVGKERCQENVQFMSERYRPDLLISAGFAGGAVRTAKPGDVFICEKLVAVEGPVFLWGKEDVFQGPSRDMDTLFQRVLEEDPETFREGACLTVPQFVSNPDMKEWLGANLRVNLIDMESYWVDETARTLGTPCLTVKAVLDPVDQSIPRFIGDYVNEGAAIRKFRAMAHLFMNPFDAPRLVRLSRQVRTAAATLARALETIVDAKSAVTNR